MMKKGTLVFFMLIILSGFVNAQNKRFIYEYQFIPNKDEPTETKKEEMFLDISPEGSNFYSYTVEHRDSILLNDFMQQIKTSGVFKSNQNGETGLVRYSITKDYPDYKVLFYNNFSINTYKVKEERAFNWKILPEKMKIGSWEAQKAEVDFAGRHWEAWFSTEIPIQDGPYKFHGLPGLIIKLNDTTNSHQFVLQGIKSITFFSKKNLNKPNTIPVSQKQYEKLVIDYENDPTRAFKNIEPGKIRTMRGDGTFGPPNFKEDDARMKAQFKKDNNRIELITK